MPEAILPLFAYGTLRDPALLDRLLGPSPERTLVAAELRDFAKVWRPGFDYPLVVPQPGARVRGVLIFGLDGEAYRVLDDYEGVAEGDYRRIQARVWPRGAERQAVEAYVYAAGPRWEPPSSSAAH